MKIKTSKPPLLLPGTASVEEVHIDPCTQEPCTLPRGGSSTISIKFTPQKDYAEVHSKVHGKLGPIYAPFPIDHPDHCKPDLDTGITCPLKAGTEIDFHYTIPVKKMYPAVSVLFYRSSSR